MSNDKTKEPEPTKAEKPQPPRFTGKLFVLCELSEYEECKSILAKLEEGDVRRYVEHEEDAYGQAPPASRVRPVIELPIARLDEGDAVCAIVRSPTRELVPHPKKEDVMVPRPGKMRITAIHLAKQHWAPDERRGSGRVNVAGFLNELSRTIMPATIKRNDPKVDEDAIRIAYA